MDLEYPLFVAIVIFWSLFALAGFGASIANWIHHRHDGSQKG